MNPKKLKSLDAIRSYIDTNQFHSNSPFVSLLERPFGIEIETSTELEELRKICTLFFTRYNCNVNFFPDNVTSKGKSWDIKFDGTTESEIATPILSLKSKEAKILYRLLNFLNQHDVKITKKDSVHIHVNCDGAIMHTILANWLYFENQFMDMSLPVRVCKDTFNSPSYSAPFYIGPNKDNTNIDSDCRRYKHDAIDHHQDLSFLYWKKRKTVEFRLHEGSLDPFEVWNWARLCISFVNSCCLFEIDNSLKSHSSKFNELVNFVNADNMMVKWMRNRIKEMKV